MINSLDSVVENDSIWDLHIHTCKCPKGSSDFVKLSVDKYVSSLANIFKNHPDLKMISFTDHNRINDEVYKAFDACKTGIKLIVGVEVDVYLTSSDVEEKVYKHIIFYFDDEKFDMDADSKRINEYLQEKTDSKGAVLLHEFLDFLITEIKKPFLLSPHFMKQRKRGIEYNWDEDETKKNIDKYIDQMCCFWETSNNTNIQRAIDLLKEFDKGDRVSVISFSDSNNFEKLRNYLDNPCQYFHSLPTFNGLRLAESDCRRISFSKKVVTRNDKACCLGKITQGDDNVVYLSSGLNSIVGGRGSGKSLFLDGIALFLNRDKVQSIFKEQSDDRVDYLDKLQVKAFDMNGCDLASHSFHFDYYNQGFAQELFKKNSDLMTSQYFKEKFDGLKNFDTASTKANILEEIKCDAFVSGSFENITSLATKVIKINDGKCEIKFKKMKKGNDALTYKDFKDVYDYLCKKKFIPDQLKNNENIKIAFGNLVEAVYKETHDLNVNLIHENVEWMISDKYKAILNSHNAQKKQKCDVVNLLKESIKQKLSKINKRVQLVNHIVKAACMEFSDKDDTDSKGYNGRKFIFQRRLDCENFLKYLHRMFAIYFDANKLKKFNATKKEFSDLRSMIDAYCFHSDEVISDSKSSDDLDKELENLESYKIEVIDEILVKDGLAINNLKNMSPGTRANLLLEYIVFNESDKPLLIDQPEDNIDNETIYNQLTTWFSALKKKRQVIVVTHDANIVINSDSENVILCSQKSNDVFDYKSSALEYGDTLDDISVLLDGGRQAIERRLLKYGQSDSNQIQR